MYGPNDIERMWNNAIGKAVEHVRAQHVVWDNTDVPPKVLLEIIAKNLEAMKYSQSAAVHEGINDADK